MEVLHDLDYGVKITTAITKKPLKIIRSIFVDDTDLVSGRLNNGMSDRDKIITDIQKAIDCWEGYLKFIGGAI